MNDDNTYFDWKTQTHYRLQPVVTEGPKGPKGHGMTIKDVARHKDVKALIDQVHKLTAQVNVLETRLNMMTGMK